jgi:RimJ/RimL family protein N-acetyltransferase
MEIRHIREEDASKFLELNKKLDQETSFMLYEPGERQTGVEQQRQAIERITTEDNSTFFVAVNEEELVGFLAILGGKNQRNKHSAYIVIGILQDYTGKGLGTSLFNEGFKWAKAKHLYRLELTVMTHNQKGITLYEKMGFKREGIKRASLRINDQWVDEYYYSYLMEE